MPTPEISLCMITKNEEKDLAQCLESVKNLVSEIIIVDTGSTDKTKEIAKEYDAKVFDYTWKHDFADARNESITKATKEWILFLDADETMNPDDINELKAQLESTHAHAIQFIRRNYTNDSSIENWIPNQSSYPLTKNCLGFFPAKIVKLFRNDKRIRFSGVVHEGVEKSLKKNQLKIIKTSIPLHHFAYMDQVNSKEKLKYYLDLCQKKVEIEPDNPQAWFELGLNYKDLDNKQKSLEAFQEAVRKDKSFVLAYLEIAQILKEDKQYQKAGELYSLVLHALPNNESALFGKGMCNYYLRNYENAIQFLEKAHNINKLNPKTLTSLGAIYEKQSKLTDAKDRLEKSISLNPQNPKPYLNLGIVCEKMQNYGDSLKWYQKAVNRGHPKKETIKEKIKEMRTKY